MFSLGEHTHDNEIRKRWLKLNKVAKILEAVEVVPTSKCALQ